MPINSFEDYPMSWKPIIDRNHRSLYRTLAQQLEEDITKGILIPGTKLPPQRELADFLDVNLSTISKAFRLCELKGLLSATVGSGTYVAYGAVTNLRLLSANTCEKVIDMGATMPEPSGNSFLMEMLKDMIADDRTKGLFSYPEPSTEEWQKDVAVELMSQCGHTVGREEILFSNGGQNALSAVIAALLKRGDKIAVDDHTYPGIKSAAAMFGIQLVPVPSTQIGMDVNALATICKTEKIKAIYIIPACHNPTTATMPQKQREQVAQIAEKYNCLMIEDGTYQLMQSGVTSISDYIKERSVYITSLSKVIAPGLRIAYLSAPKPFKEAVSNALYSLNVSVVPMMAELSARIIASGQFETIMEEHKRNTIVRNNILNRWLPHNICCGGDTDIFRWLSLPDKYSGTDFEILALSKGIQVYAAEKFVIGNTPPARAVRLSICTPKDVLELEQGVKNIAELLK